MTTPKKLTTDQFELIEAAFDVFLMKQNNGKGLDFLNRQAGRILATLETHLENYHELQR